MSARARVDRSRLLAAAVATVAFALVPVRAASADGPGFSVRAQSSGQATNVGAPLFSFENDSGDLAQPEVDVAPVAWSGLGASIDFSGQASLGHLALSSTTTAADMRDASGSGTTTASNASGNLDWRDTATITSDTLPIGTPVQLQLTLDLTGSATHSSYAWANIQASFEAGVTGITFDQAVNGPPPSAPLTLVISSGVGSEVPLEGLVHAESQAGPPYFTGLTADGRADVDATFCLEPVTAGISYTTASGQTYAACDKTPPAIACGSPDGRWHAQNVAIECTAYDDGSGLASPDDANFSLATTVPLGSESADAITGVRLVCDNAGNCATAGPVDGNEVDEKAPATSCASPDGIWHGDDVSIPCTASDSGSGLANAGDAAFGLSTSTPVGSDDSNATTNSKSVCDAVGNCATAGPIEGNEVDRKLPSLSLTAPADGTAYVLNQMVPSSFVCSDTGSGVASCLGSVANGNDINTASVGTKTFTVTARDAVGNTATQTVNYGVRYAFGLGVVWFDRGLSEKSLHEVLLKIYDATGANVSSSSVKFVVTAVDSKPVSGTFTYVGLSKQPGSYQYTPPPLAAGTHTLTFRRVTTDADEFNSYTGTFTVPVQP